MKIECQECLYIGIEEEFEGVSMVPDSVGKGLHEEEIYKCPNCGVEGDRELGDGNPLGVYFN